MFKNLRTSTKLVVLCVMFIISIVATTYSLVAEKQIALAFARKELIGTIYLTAMRSIYAAVLAAPPIGADGGATNAPTSDPLQTLATVESFAGARLQTGEAVGELTEALRLWSGRGDGAVAYGLALDVLAKARQLVARIADNSNLALDPDLDSYHIQDLIARKLPAFFRQLSELQILARETGSAAPSNEQKVRFRIMEGLLRSITGEVKDNLAAAYRGNPDGSLKPAVEGAFAVMMTNTNAYLDGLNVRFDGGGKTAGSAQAPDRLYDSVVTGATRAWAGAETELDRLLRARIGGLERMMLLSLALTGALAGISIVIAVMTHRHIVRPLERLESIASTVRETKDYSLRIDHVSGDEIGRLAASFNDMLSELAAARERERAVLVEFMRAARLTTMGAMTASIAHEINQPLAAIVANSNAAQRWLGNARPDLDEARAALKNIVRDGHRASQVIGSVRAMFKKDSGEKTLLAVNEIIEDILALVHGEIRKQSVLVQTELPRDLPDVVADRTQLLQVFMNLIRNAVDAMAAVSTRERLLVVKSHASDPSTVMITVEDSGTGIASGDLDRIFDAFYTTKSDGMGLGLSICRSIVEGHGGRLWASSGLPHGTVFHLTLPSGGQ